MSWALSGGAPLLRAVGRRYNRILAPQLRVFEDQRINLRQADLDAALDVDLN